MSSPSESSQASTPPPTLSEILPKLASADPNVVAMCLKSLKPILSEPLKEASAALDALEPLIWRDVEAARCMCNLLFKNQKLLKAAGPR